MRVRLWALMIVLALMVGACAAAGRSGAGSAAPSPADTASTETGPEGRLLVFAAASLTDAFGDLADAFTTANPEAEVAVSPAGSAALREQILAGAPADVFAAADPGIMEEVRAAGETTDGPRVFARNRLTIAVPVGNPGAVKGPGDLERPDLLIGLCAVGVPCGDLARAALADLGVEAVPDTNEPDVRALLTRIEADELDAGIVYATDVLAAAGRVESVDLDATVEASYPIAVLRSAPNPTAAAAFVDFVLSAEGQRILAEHGFLAP